MIAADTISFLRQGRTIFSPATFRFEKAEFTAIIGPNGAGKSTLLQLLSGLYKPTSGTVLIHGKKATEWKAHELAKHRAYLQQQQNVFETFTVEDVLMMGRSIYFQSFPGPKDQALVEEALYDLGLLSRKDQPFNQLSGGEQQRVQFVRTLLQLQENARDSLEGKVLFLDEPLNNLDLYYQYGLLEMVRKRIVEKGGKVIAVLHDLNMVYRFAERVIVLSSGKTIMDGPAEEALSPELLSAIYRMNIEKIEQLNQLPYFAVSGGPLGKIPSETAGMRVRQ